MQGSCKDNTNNNNSQDSPMHAQMYRHEAHTRECDKRVQGEASCARTDDDEDAYKPD